MDCVAFGDTLANIIQSQSPILGNLDERAVEIAVVLPLLSRVGWDTGNMAEVYPQSKVDAGLRKVDYALQVDGVVRFLVEVKSWNRPLQEAEENQLAGYCHQAKPDLAVLTSGSRWMLYLPPKDGKDAKLRKFLDFDITTLDPLKVQENFEKFLARGKFATKTSTTDVVRESKRLFDKRQNLNDAFERMTKAWNSLTNQSPALTNLIREITDPHPDEEQVEQFLERVQSPLVNKVPEKVVGPLVPQYITFQVEGEEAYGPVRVKLSAWRYVLDDVCRLMRERHPDTFDRILEIQGFSKSRENLKSPIEMASVELYFAYPAGHAMGYRQACVDVLVKFGYSRNCLTVRVK